jgi:TPP-dependent pyruvate/acetoin dehydrogenase alpha subunit
MPDAAELLEWLETMVLIREFEEQAQRASLRGKVPGGVHPAVGQEAVAVGAMRALGPDDVVTGGHRPHHHAIARGVDISRMMAELFGKETGLARGRAGSMHLSDFSRGYYGSNGIVGASLGLAMGAALAASMRGTRQVSVGFVGDGAANTGRTWEFVNMAVIWNLPFIAICENNLYAVETFIDNVMGGKSMVRRAEGFGIPAFEVDGQDVHEVHRAVATARERALAGEGPTFLEVKTYRYHGHETGDKGAYRTAEEVAQWRSQRDPITRLARSLLAAGSVTEETVADLQQRATARVAEALRFAEESPWPSAAGTPSQAHLDGSPR